MKEGVDVKGLCVRCGAPSESFYCKDCQKILKQVVFKPRSVPIEDWELKK